MPRSWIFQALFRAFFARDVYRDAARHRRGAGLLYALVLAAIVTLLAMLRLGVAVSGFAHREAPRIVAQLPTIVIDHGHVAVDRPSPIAIRDPDTGHIAALIDTTGRIASLEGTDASLLLTRDRLIYRKSVAEKRVFDLARVEHFVIDRERVTRWVGWMAWLPIAATPFVLVAFFVMRLIQQTVAALVTMLVARGMRLDFGTAMRLGVLAITPATLVLDLAGFAGLKVPGSGWLWCAISLGYVLFAVAGCRLVDSAAATSDTPDAGDAPAPPH